jgi:hypothetical protein
MTDLDQFEHTVRESLHAHDLPEPVSGLAQTSEKLGRSIRRRRRVGVAALALAGVIAIPGLAWNAISHNAHTQVQPAQTAIPSPVVPTPAPTAQAKAPVFHATGAALAAGPAPSVDYVDSNNVWHHRDGGATRLNSPSSDSEGTFVAYRGGLFALWNDFGADKVFYTVDDGPVTQLPPVAVTDPGAVAAAVAGPNGSILVQFDEGSTAAVLDAAGSWSTTSPFAARAGLGFHPLAGRTTLWAARSDPSEPGMVRLAGTDGAEQTIFANWSVSDDSVANARADRFTALDGDCAHVVDATSGSSVLKACGWTITAISDDGRFALLASDQPGANRNLKYHSRVVDLSDNSVVYEIDDLSVTGASFTPDNSLIFPTVEDPAKLKEKGNRYAVATCSSSGCHRITDWETDAATAGDPGYRSLVQPNNP